MKVGDKIKTFEVKDIVNGIGKDYSNGMPKKYKTKYMLLLSDKGQERILEVGKTNLNECETWFPTFGHSSKFKTWNMI